MLCQNTQFHRGYYQQWKEQQRAIRLHELDEREDERVRQESKETLESEGQEEPRERYYDTV